MSKKIESSFEGLYNVIITFNNHQDQKKFKRVMIDNEVYQLGNIRITDENSKDCN